MKRPFHPAHFPAFASLLFITACGSLEGESTAPTPSTGEALAPRSRADEPAVAQANPVDAPSDPALQAAAAAATSAFDIDGDNPLHASCVKTYPVAACKGHFDVHMDYCQDRSTDAVVIDGVMEAIAKSVIDPQTTQICKAGQCCEKLDWKFYDCDNVCAARNATSEGCKTYPKTCVDAAGNKNSASACVCIAKKKACGNGKCEKGETCRTCAVDCGHCAAKCGDLFCDRGESCATCPGDCGTCPHACGDGVCDASETCSTCAADCGRCPPVCGNHICEAGETCSNCSVDCGPCPPVCGNHICEAGETCSNCSTDCGPCPPVCGNHICEAGETCSNCSTDCGPCPPVCGNGTCEASETCSSCPSDCGNSCPSHCGQQLCCGAQGCGLNDSGFWFLDTGDAGDDAFKEGCHWQYSDAACTQNKTFSTGDVCAPNGLDLYEWTDLACHPPLPLDKKIHYCDAECIARGYAQGGACQTVQNACGPGLDSAKCVCKGNKCGNGICEAGETCMSCQADCGVCPPVCGNGVCEAGESCSTCPADCGTCPPTCGNHVCEMGESCHSCPSDCGACDMGVPTDGGTPDLTPPADLTRARDLTPPVDMTPIRDLTPPIDMIAPLDLTPPVDLTVLPDLTMPTFCGDGLCNGGESCFSCLTDCGPCFFPDLAPPPDLAPAPDLANPCGDPTLYYGSCCGVCYLKTPQDLTDTAIEYDLPSGSYPSESQLAAMPSSSDICPCTGQPFAFHVAAAPPAAQALPNAAVGNRANATTAFQMTYLAGQFTCKDFAWTADEASEKVHNRASWEIAIYSDDRGDGVAGAYAGHALHIVRMQPANQVQGPYFCIVEPQSDRVVACWFQLNADRPNALLKFVLDRLHAAYPRWGQTNARVKIWNSGQPANWGNPFSVAAVQTQFVNQTGYTAAQVNGFDITYRE